MIKNEHLIDVQPIRSKKQLDDMKWALDYHCSKRDYILFLIGINTGLRVGDLLQLKAEQILKLKRKKERNLLFVKAKRRKNGWLISRLSLTRFIYTLKN
ncbi:putative integrase [Bacillus cereus ATCC 4342]|nr:putative integrase [Bacillus cereus ATCC 4342]